MDRGIWWATVRGVTKSRTQTCYAIYYLLNIYQYIIYLIDKQKSFTDSPVTPQQGVRGVALSKLALMDGCPEPRAGQPV